MNILIDARVINPVNIDGLAVYTIQLLKRLQYKEDNIIVLINSIIDLSLHNIYSTNIKIVRTNISPLGIKNIINNYLLLKKYKNYIYHYPQFNMPITNIKKTVCTIHDFKHFNNLTVFQKPIFLYKLYAQLTTKYSINKAKKVLAVSDFTKDEIIQHIPSAKNKVITIYEDCDNSFKKENFEKNVLDKYNISKEYYLYVGAWRPHKNIFNMIEAFLYMQQKTSRDDIFVFSGYKDKVYFDIKELEEKYNIFNRIKFIGYADIKDLPSLYHYSTAFMFCSLYEGFGIPILEAFNSKTPLITSDNGAMSEVADHCSLVANPNNVLDIAKQMEYILDVNIRNEYIKLGFKKAEEYNWDLQFEEIYQIYLDIDNAY
jgi:glycosyltransferase involved in cell wall biosynthesis